MTTCTPSYSVQTLPIEPDCSGECAGTTFAVSDMKSSFKDGKCSFEYTVTREGPKGIKEFTGSESIGCPSTLSKVYHCDDAGACPRFRVTLKCEQE